jgi:hypothetical protein
MTNNGEDSHSLNIGRMASMGLLPTPTTGADCATQYKQGGRSLKNYMIYNQILPTSRVKGHGNSHQRTEDGKMDDLTTLAKMGMLPTPATRDYKGARSSEALAQAGRKETNSLPDAFAQTGKTSQLNPQFVAEMMGFPTDWTILPFQSGETKVSRDMEMP